MAVALAAGLLSACEGTSEDEVLVRDLRGETIAPLAADRPTVALFVDTQCPISNRYAPAMSALYERFAPEVQFWLVYPNSALTPAQIRTHLAEYRLPERALLDPEHRLVRHARARVTPEAAVFDADGRLVYHGRIDDRFVDFNQQRPAPTHRDVQEVLQALLDGRSVQAGTTVAPGTPVDALHRPGVGCFVADLK